MENLFGKDVEVLFFGAKIKQNNSYSEAITEKLRRFNQVSRDLRNNLEYQNIKFIEAGQLKVRTSDICHECGAEDCRLTEKGVDIGLAVSMVEDRLFNKEDEFVLVSSDTDLLPAVKTVRRNNGKVIYVGFQNRITKALTYSTDEMNIIRDSEIIEAYKEFNREK